MASRKDGRKSRKRTPSKRQSTVLTPATGGFWDRLPARTRHAVVLFVLVAVSAVFFAPATFQGQQLIGSDTLQSRAMAKSMTDYKSQTGEEALWATNLFSGMPGYLIIYTKVAIQPDVVMRWFRRHLWPTMQFLLFVVGVYVFVFYTTGNEMAALIAALGAGLTTYVPIILSVGHTSKFMALSWIPWLMIVFTYILRNPRLIGAAVFAALLAMELRAGHPQITYYAVWLFAIWWAVELVGAVRSGNQKKFALSTGILAFGVILAVLMVAQPYMAQIEYKQFSTRGGSAAGVGGEVSGLDWDYAMNWSQGKVELLTLLIANLQGGGPGTYWGDKLFTEGPHYLGGVILLLAVIAVVGKRGLLVWSLFIAASVMTMFSLGKNMAWFNRPFFDYVPMFSAFRAPEMWLHLVELTIATLAGIGAAYLVGTQDAQRRRKFVFISFGCVFALSLLVTIGADSLFSFEKPGEAIAAARQLAAREGVAANNPAVQQAVGQYLNNVKTSRIELFKTDAHRTLIVLLLAGGMIWFYFRGAVPAWALTSALALLVLFDLWGVGKRHLDDSDYASGPVDEQIQTFDFDRYILDRVDEAGGPGHFRVLSLEQSPVNWARPAFHYESSGGYNAAKLKVYQDFMDDVLFDRTTGLPTTLGLDLTATRYVVANRLLPGTQPVFNDQSTGLAVLERTMPQPRSWFVGDYRVTPTRSEAVDFLWSDDFDIRRVAAIAEDPSIDPSPIDSSSVANVTLTTFGPMEITWDVETDAERLLVVSEVYYPAGWKAFVDGTPTKIFQTNYAFRGVVVPAGSHEVRMVFEPRAHELSIWISVASTTLVYGWLLIVFGLMVVSRVRKDG